MHELLRSSRYLSHDSCLLLERRSGMHSGRAYLEARVRSDGCSRDHSTGAVQTYSSVWLPSLLVKRNKNARLLFHRSIHYRRSGGRNGNHLVAGDELCPSQRREVVGQEHELILCNEYTQSVFTKVCPTCWSYVLRLCDLLIDIRMKKAERTLLLIFFQHSSLHSLSIVVDSRWEVDCR